ncbi:tripartite tricarboxylate transporter substrate binding protein [Roseiarcaceae bacterium H3SJ34-1]|uniref:Bug family tripartite tricarboxylate transporter substrate binding protein n=1 Tax=Terripilifer ovatus TaxID=3032367 RepID=UPI003AB9A61A|nr:tripartite tricarboxylate transporter substrate binding protein [Roseiarcaceae bacterium H3SJ34-1]
MFKGLLAIVLSVSLMAGAATAVFAKDDYPVREIHFICGFPAGSGADILVRYFSDRIAKKTGHTIIVENKPGFGGMLALTQTAKARPDGYTILLAGGNAVAINANLLKNPPVDVGKDIKVAATINKMPFLLAVDSASPNKSLSELTEALRRKGNQASYAYSSPFSKVIAESYKTAAGLQTVEVAYKGATDSLNDMASGAVDFAILDPVMALAQQKAGKLRILAISTSNRTRATGDLPTFGEQGVRVDLAGWWAALVPAGTPDAIVQTINGWFADVLAEEDTKTFLANNGADALSMPAAQANSFFLEEIKTWGQLIEMARIEKQ